MEVEVRDLLAGGLARIEADCVSGGPMLVVEQAFDVSHEGKQVCLFLRGRLPPCLDEPARHQERMARDRRIGGRDGERRRVAGEMLAGWDGKERRKV